jgi:hypothetical protein
MTLEVLEADAAPACADAPAAAPAAPPLPACREFFREVPAFCSGPYSKGDFKLLVHGVSRGVVFGGRVAGAFVSVFTVDGGPLSMRLPDMRPEDARTLAVALVAAADVADGKGGGL